MMTIVSDGQILCADVTVKKNGVQNKIIEVLAAC